jgi:hypothetical protein
LELTNAERYEDSQIKISQTITALTDTSVEFDLNLSDLPNISGQYFLFFTNKYRLRTDGFPVYYMGTPIIVNVVPDTLASGLQNIRVSGNNFGSASNVASVSLELLDSQIYDQHTITVPQKIITFSDSLIEFDVNTDDFSTAGIYYLFFTNKHGLRNEVGYPVHVSLSPSGVRNITHPFQTFELRQSYPNPFNPSTTISYTIPEKSKVVLTIFSMLGQKVRTLVNEALVTPGFRQVTWNARDDFGNSVPSGLYFCKLEAGDKVLSRKILFIK